jgi:hypothetical protein
MIDLTKLNSFRDDGNLPVHGPEFEGRFFFPSLTERRIAVIACSGDGWDHVSVSMPNQIPPWSVMSMVYTYFFKPDEVAYQLHVPAVDHININPNVLHIWRPHRGRILLPPKFMV